MFTFSWTHSHTFESLIQLILAEDHPQVMDGTGVELDPEHHISAGVPEALVIARQLEERRGGEGIEEEGRGRKSTFDHVYMGRWAGQSLR